MIRVVADDFDGPYVDDREPGDGETVTYTPEVIEFNVNNDDKSVDSSTIGCTVEDDTKGTVPRTLFIDDSDTNDVRCVYVFDDPLSDGEYTVTVPGTVADLFGNEMGADAVRTFYVDISGTGIAPSSIGRIKAEYK